MNPLVPLFVPGVPGGPELLIMLFVLFFLTLPVIGIAIVLWAIFGGKDDGSDRRATRDADVALERRVSDLERRVDRLETGGRDD